MSVPKFIRVAGQLYRLAEPPPQFTQDKDELGKLEADLEMAESIGATENAKQIRQKIEQLKTAFAPRDKYYADMPGAKYVIALSPEEEEILFQIHEGQGDAVYAVASRSHSAGLTWVTEDELSTVVSRLAWLLSDATITAEMSEQEQETAASLLYELENLSSGSTGIEYPPGVIREFDLQTPPSA
ncbi:MAG: hypothetical protein WC505_06975 [Patescibacteria group bacterium]